MLFVTLGCQDAVRLARRRPWPRAEVAFPAMQGRALSFAALVPRDNFWKPTARELKRPKPDSRYLLSWLRRRRCDRSINVLKNSCRALAQQRIAHVFAKGDWIAATPLFTKDFRSIRMCHDRS